MTLTRYKEILEGTLSEGGWVSQRRANQQYAEEFPDMEFTIFRRENDRIQIGFTTGIMPTCYLETYFKDVPARREGIVYQSEGTFDSVMENHRTFLAERMG